MEREIVLQNSAGLHARPAALFIQEAKKYSCEIEVEKDGKKANAKSILAILSLGITKGSLIKIRASGTDEREALDALTGLIDSKFDED